MLTSITIVIIAITALISILAFSSRQITDELIFYPPAVTNRGQFYRFFTCGLIHADLNHLLFNMLSLYMFGEMLEAYFNSTMLFAEKGKVAFILLYVLGLLFSLLPTYAKHKNDYHYRSLGASGAVSAVVFAALLLNPTIKVGFYFIPPIIPGYVFGPLYLIVSGFLGKKGKDNINHSAHIFGALFGIGFTIALSYSMHTEYQPIPEFILKVKSSLAGYR
jgi:membrane associated rhomboid family serine protease